MNKELVELLAKWLKIYFQNPKAEELIAFLNRAGYEIRKIVDNKDGDLV